jgi:glycosyltransferase involved in cell wall biosynthesis
MSNVTKLFDQFGKRVARLLGQDDLPDVPGTMPLSDARRVIVVSADVLPYPGLPTTGAGLRAWGLGLGLRARGHDVSFAVPFQVLEKFQPLRHPDLIVMEDVNAVVRDYRPDVLVFQHWVHVPALETEGAAVVIDFHGPLLLETLYRDGAGVQEYIQVKLRALKKADFFTCAGEFQRNYFYAWLIMAGFDLRRMPIEVIPFSMSPDIPTHEYPTDEVEFVYGGVFLPWQDPSVGLRALIETMDTLKRGHLTFYGGAHPWIHLAANPLFDVVKRLLETSPRCAISPTIPRDQLVERYRKASVAWDVMAHNAERGMAFTSRTVEYLWAGLPVVYNNYAELARYIERYEAGWTVDPTDPTAIKAVVREILTHPAEVARRGANAQRLVREALNWETTIAPLDRFVRDPERWRAQRFPTP